ncbi:MAG: hypothetical protein WC169_11540 [Dehalococcoidia bacterium]|jgi:hypothetical protein
MAVILTTRHSGGSSTSSINSIISNEDVVGEKNNDNTTFNTQYNYVIGALMVYYNGQRLIKDLDYKEEGGNIFRLIYIKPYVNDCLVVDYQIPT